MTQQVVTVEQVRGLVGKEEKVVTVEVDRGIIRRFAQAIGDPNPLWQDEEYAKKSKFGGIVAPPELLCTSMMSGGAIRPEVALPFVRVLDGGGEWEFYAPIMAGDRITSSTKFVELKEKAGKTGKMLFLIFETLHRNQRGELVAKSGATLLNIE